MYVYFIQFILYLFYTIIDYYSIKLPSVFNNNINIHELALIYKSLIIKCNLSTQPDKCFCIESFCYSLETKCSKIKIIFKINKKIIMRSPCMLPVRIRPEGLVLFIFFISGQPTLALRQYRNLQQWSVTFITTSCRTEGKTYF